MKKFLLAFLLCLAAIPALAQNTTCATRAPGDSTNACASTAFVQNNTTGFIAPVFPLTAPSSPGAPSWTGSGCNLGTALPGHVLPWTDQNWCLNQYNLSILGNEPSAAAPFNIAGSISHVGEAICQTFSFINGGPTENVCYTVANGDTAVDITAGIVNAIIADPVLYSQPIGGYNSGKPIAYVQLCGVSCFTIDFNSQYYLLWSYTVSNAGAETITAPSGWFAGQVNNAGTTAGTANAQTLSVPSFRSHVGENISFTAGSTNTTTTTLTVNALSAFVVKKYVNGVLTNLSSGDLTSGNSYIVAFDGGATYILGSNSVYISNGSTQATQYLLPNSLDSTFVHFYQRTASPGTQANGLNSFGFAPASYLWDLTVGCNNTNAASLFISNVNCATQAVVGINSTPAGIDAAWFFSTASNGSGFFIGNGIWANGGCTTLLAPGGCGLFEKGAGSINVNTYWTTNVKISDGAGQLYNLGVPVVNTGPAAWTPTDGSGAGLTFTSVSASWSQSGNMVFAYGTLTYPATADATLAKISGLPVTLPNQSYATQCSVTYSNVGNAARVVPIKNTATASIANTSGTAMTNANISGAQIVFECIYPAL